MDYSETRRYFVTVKDGYGRTTLAGGSDPSGYALHSDALIFARTFVGSYAAVDFTIWEAMPLTGYIKKEQRFYNIQEGTVN